MRSKLARNDQSIVLPSLDLIQDNDPAADLFNLPDSPYHLAEDEIIVDLFCGAGGTSEGVLQALGESPAFALNHDADAIGVHGANHPETVHLESDIFAVDPADHIPAGKRIGMLLASPSCTHFSAARGGKPVDHQIRDHAWSVVNWCEHPEPRFRPRVVVVENVREYLSWAPLTHDNRIDKRYIDKNGLGSTFKEWRARLIAGGYDFDYQILNAAEYGVGTQRRRLIIIARNDGLPIRFPKPTHGPRNSPLVEAGLLKPFRSAAESIDFKRQCNPIFMYAEDAKKAGANRPLAPNTLRRIAAGVERFVIESDDPYIVSYYGPKDGAGFRGQRLDEPLPTQSTENRFALVNPMITPVTHAGPGRYYQLDGQFPTITCASRGELALLSPVCATTEHSGALIPLRRDTNPVGLNGLVPALTTNSQIALAIGGFAAATSPAVSYSGSLLDVPFLTATGGSQYAAKPRCVGRPINTIVCHNRSAIIVPTLVRVAHGSVDRNGKRRGRGDHDITQPLPTQSTSNEFAVVEPCLVASSTFMITTGYGERAGQAPRMHAMSDPLNTFVAAGAKQAVVAANLIRTDMPRSNAGCSFPMGDPINTFTTSGGFALVETGLAACNDNLRIPLIVNNNTNRLATSVDDPVPAMTTGNQQIVAEAVIQPSAEMIAAHMAQQNTGNVGHSVQEPISTMTTKVCHQNLVTSHLLTLRQNGFGRSMDDPAPAFCAAGNHHGEVRACFVKYYGEGSQFQSMHAPLDTLTAKARFAVVSVPVEELGLTEDQRFEAWWIARFLEEYGTKDEGNPLTAHLAGPRPSVVGRPGAVLWTIQMRMLVPQEAFDASSFPKHYEFEKTAAGKRVTKTTQMKLVGNAVPPGLARAVVAANLKPRKSVASRLAAPLDMAA